MTSRQYILDQIRTRRRQSFDMPSLEDVLPVRYEDRLGQFISALEQVGGKALILEPGQNIDELMRSLYPSASVIASNLPYINSSINPDIVHEASELNGVDLGVVEGRIAVAENGCVWIPQTMKERAVLFISECLVIIVDSDAIVNNMHEAYSAVKNDSYGCFISGPSKTADIAQALVMGAQAARDVVVIVRPVTN